MTYKEYNKDRGLELLIPLIPSLRFIEQTRFSMSRKSKAAEFVDQGYNITITGRSINVTDAMKNYALEKISKIERYSNRIIDVTITMDVQKLQHRVDIVAKVDHIKIKSQAISEDMYISIDRAITKLESQIYRYHDKVRDHHAIGIPAVDMTVNVLSRDVVDEFNGEIEEENQQDLIERYNPHKIVRQEMMPLKILTQDEAILKMELSGEHFLVYRSEEDMKLRVIYRRSEDDQLAIIKPEV